MYQGLPVEEHLYRSLVEMGLKSGVKSVVAKTYAYLFMEPGRLSMEELATKTGYSLASISNAVKFLELIKKVRRIKEPGSKRVYVQAEKNFIHTVNQQFKHATETTLLPLQEILPLTIDDLNRELKKPGLGKEEKQRIKEKMACYEDHLEQSKKIMQLFNSMEAAFRKLEQEYQART